MMKMGVKKGQILKAWKAPVTCSSNYSFSSGDSRRQVFSQNFPKSRSVSRSIWTSWIIRPGFPGPGPIGALKLHDTRPFASRISMVVPSPGLKDLTAPGALIRMANPFVSFIGLR